ncbi:MAG: IS1595 family transposase [Gemmatimonadaceae bacterium]
MRAPAFKKLVAQLHSLTRRQQQDLAALLRSPTTPDPAAALRLTVCPHCRSPHMQGWGRTPTGLARSRCRACQKTATVLTATPFARLRHRTDWPSLMRDLADGRPALKIADRHHVNYKTAVRWLHRWVAAAPSGVTALEGLVEADETFVRRSAKGRPTERAALGRLPRKRGGGDSVGSGRRSKEFQPVLVARSRTGQSAALLLPGMTAQELGGAAAQLVAPGAVLITDGLPSWGLAACWARRHHEAVNVAQGERVRGVYHLQGVNGSHARFRKFLMAFNGVSTHRLPFYLRWFLLLEQRQHPEELMHEVLKTNTK